jgi:hypothetical protein
VHQATFCLSRCKTVRDNSDILGMAPRSLIKHLEHVFSKLSMKTRSASATIAARCITQQQKWRQIFKWLNHSQARICRSRKSWLDVQFPVRRKVKKRQPE